jgi:Fic family protein
MFVLMYVRREAVLSSQIEGTQASLSDVLEYEEQVVDSDKPRDVEEVINYISAMNHGLRRLSELPVSLRLVREIHLKLLEGVKGGERSPGEFRQLQNWVGAPGSTIQTASHVPPPVPEMKNALDNLEKFLHSKDKSLY